MSNIIRIKFSRKGPVRYLGHLDMLRYFQKAVMRSGIPAKYSGGYHPHQLMSFAYPLGVSMETEGDYLDLELTEETPAETKIMNALNSVMHEGIQVLGIRYLAEGETAAMAAVEAADYRLALHGDFSEEELKSAVNALLSQEYIYIAPPENHKKNKRKKSGETESEGKDIRPGILEMKADGRLLTMRLVSGSRMNVRPADVYEQLLPYLPNGREYELYCITRLEIYRLSDDGDLLPL